MIMKYYMQIEKPSDKPLTSSELSDYSKTGWDLVTVKPTWNKQRLGMNTHIIPVPRFETWIFSKESEIK